MVKVESTGMLTTI